MFLTLFSRSVSSSDRPWERHHLVPFYRQLLFTVKSLHALDISHEDIKRSNILIGKNNTPVLVDFGFGHFNPNRLYVKSAGGTLDYTSPEKVLVSWTARFGTSSDRISGRALRPAGK